MAHTSTEILLIEDKMQTKHVDGSKGSFAAASIVESNAGDILSKGHTVIDQADMSRLDKRQESKVSTLDKVAITEFQTQQ